MANNVSGHGTRTKIKEGFLVKKGHVRHNWKTRWFVLEDQSLVYYKRKDDSEPTGRVPLNGCFLVSPCTEYTKKGGVFRLTAKDGIEYLLQAANDSERDSWTVAIAEIIRKLEAANRWKEASSKSAITSQKLQTVHKFTAQKLGEISEAMQDANAGIPLSSHTVDMKQYKLCFSGQQVIEWLLKWMFVKDREEGIILADALLEEAYLQPVGIRSKSSFKSSRKTSKDKGFCDEEKALYRFSALRHSNNESFDGEFSDDSSDSDVEGGKEQCGAIKGTIVKQGFLMKKGHVRKKWKTRRFILCKDPVNLYYCKPSKETIPVGRIPLEHGEVKMLRTDDEVKILRTDDEQKSAPPNGTEFRKSANQPLLVIRTWKGVKYVLKGGSEAEIQEWVESLKQLAHSSKSMS